MNDNITKSAAKLKKVASAAVSSDIIKAGLEQFGADPESAALIDANITKVLNENKASVEAHLRHDVILRFVFGYMTATQGFVVRNDLLVRQGPISVAATGLDLESLESGFIGLTPLGEAAVDVLESRAIKPVITARGIDIRSGATVVVGVANMSKSPIMVSLRNSLEGSRTVLFGEPVGEGTTSSARKAARLMLEAILDDNVNVILLDSVKNLVSRSRGALMSKGSARELLPMLSDWSLIGIQLGKAIVTVVNIGTSDEEAIKEYQEALSSNTVSVITAAGTGTFSSTTRTGYARLRLSQRLALTFDGSGTPNFAAEGSTSSSIPARGPFSAETARQTMARPSLGIKLDNHGPEFMGPYVDNPVTSQAVIGATGYTESQLARTLSKLSKQQ
jgi:hypothetical protein